MSKKSQRGFYCVGAIGDVCISFCVFNLTLFILLMSFFPPPSSQVNLTPKPTRKLPEPPAKSPTQVEIKEHLYLALAKLTTEEWDDCGITILSFPSNTDWKKEDDSFRNHFFSELSSKIIPYEFHTIPVGKDEKINQPKQGNHKIFESSRRFGGSQECAIILAEVYDSSSIPKIVEKIKYLIQPKPLHAVKVLLLNFEAVPTTSMASKASLLHWKVLETIPYKMEMVGGLTHGYELRAILFAFCSYCPQNKAEGRKPNGYQLIGGFSKSSGYRRYNELFPKPPTNFQKTKTVPIKEPIRAAPKTKQIGPQKKEKLSKAVEETVKKLVDRKATVNARFNKKNLPIQLDPTSRTGFAMIKAFNLSWDARRTLFLNRKGLLNITEMDSILSEELISFALNYNMDRNNPLYKVLQSSMCYKSQRGLILFRELEISAYRIAHDYFWECAESILIFCTVSAIFLMLGRKWDLLSRFRLPRPVDRDTWRYYSRRISWNRFVNLFGTSLEYYFQQVPLPRRNLRRFAPSGTIWILFFCLLGIIHLWFVKFIPVIDRLAAPKMAVDIQTLDDVARVFGGKVNVGKEVKVYSMFDPDYWKDFLKFVENGERKHLLKNLFEKMIFIENGFECIANVLVEDDSHYPICMGYFNLETDGRTQFDFQMGKPLQIRYIGQTIFYSFGFASQFPYFEQFNKALFSIVESGLYQYWTKLVLEVGIGPQDGRKQADEKKITFDRFWVIMAAPLFCYFIATMVFIVEVIVGYRLIPRAWKLLCTGASKICLMIRALLATLWKAILKLLGRCRSIESSAQGTPKLTSEQIEKLTKRDFENNPALQFLR